MADERPLDGSLAIVTGALGNLGPHWVSALAGAGARVVGIDIRTDGRGELDPACRLEQGDVTDRASLEAVRDRIAELGPPDVLVNNAGIDAPPDAAAQRHAIEDVPTEAFSGTLEVNLTGTFHAIQVFGSAMRDAGRGSIVNVGSLYASVAPDPELYSHLPGDPPFLKPPAYGASKAGVVSLTRYFARLWGPHGVRVNTLSPGGVAAGQDEEFVRRYCSRVPMRRMAEPHDLLGPLLFLSSDASRYVSGQELRVDGGFTA
jgi:NAD(P)-dependent dehydrogenase (short-subunit alcohol dehydrogenase family)